MVKGWFPSGTFRPGLYVYTTDLKGGDLSKEVNPVIDIVFIQ